MTQHNCLQIRGVSCNRLVTTTATEVLTHTLLNRSSSELFSPSPFPSSLEALETFSRLVSGDKQDGAPSDASALTDILGRLTLWLASGLF